MTESWCPWVRHRMVGTLTFSRSLSLTVIRRAGRHGSVNMSVLGLIEKIVPDVRRPSIHPQQGRLQGVRVSGINAVRCSSLHGTMATLPSECHIDIRVNRFVVEAIEGLADVS